ncbi:hypothetical protein EV424DRAFT_1629636 [Suillus variegatus]|nr:hypothetical protein EV424DRAFT_1629636 [Suillus variegatus]
MSPHYKLVISEGALTPDSALLESMEKDSEEELKKRLDERLAKAEKQEGESDISDALKARANHLTRIGDNEAAAAAIDAVLTLIRLGFFFGDDGLMTENLPKAERCAITKLCQDIELTYHPDTISIRQLKAGGALLLDALSTFTATELNLIATPEVISVLPIPILGDLLNNLYDCHYAKFCIALTTLEQMYPLPSQLLESYRSLTLESLSGAFGVSVEFVDSELSRLIASRHLHYTIDKVHGIVETTRPSLENTRYDKVIKQGDALLNSIQSVALVLYVSSQRFVYLTVSYSC